jgi:hypothetical protein
MSERIEIELDFDGGCEMSEIVGAGLRDRVVAALRWTDKSQYRQSN